jgi:hypothetical protein
VPCAPRMTAAFAEPRNGVPRVIDRGADVERVRFVEQRNALATSPPIE